MWFCTLCRKGQVKSFFERKVCDFCRISCEPVDVPYSGWTLAAWGVLLVCAALFLAYREALEFWKWGILIGAIILAGGLASIGVAQMKRTAEDMCRDMPMPENRSNQRKSLAATSHRKDSKRNKSV